MSGPALHILRFFLPVTSPIGRYPIGVLRQLAGYNGDWLHSRGIPGDHDCSIPRGGGFAFATSHAAAAVPPSPRLSYAR